MHATEKAERLLVSLNSPFAIKDVKDGIFEYLRYICSIYDETPSSANIETSNKTKELVECLPEICKPKELLIALLEEINCFKSPEKFVALIGPIQKCLLLLPKNHSSVMLAYEALCAHFESEPLPQTSFECTEKLVPDAKYTEILNLVDVFLKHFGYFVEELHSKLLQSQQVNSSLKKEAQEFSFILLRIFAKPLAYLPLECGKESCELQCLSLFEMLQNDIVKFLQKTLEWKKEQENALIKSQEKTKQEIETGDDEDDLVESIHWDVEIACGVLSYLIFQETYYGDLIPQVLSKTYIFQMLLPLISHLIQMGQGYLYTVDKGCTLMMNLLKRVGTQGLEIGISCCDSTKSTVESLIQIMSSCHVKEIAEKALQCINALLWALQPSDRLSLLSFIIHNTNHSGIQGFVVTALKNQLLEVGANSFDAAALRELLNYVFCLRLPDAKNTSKSKKAITDILDNMDRLMATLNFLIFLIIRNSSEANRTKLLNEVDFASFISRIQSSFMDPLKQEIEDSRSHCLTELAFVKKRVCNKDESDSFNNILVNEACEGPTKEDKERALMLMLVNLDLMESVLKRAQLLMFGPVEGTDVVKSPRDIIAPPTALIDLTARFQLNSRFSPFPV